MATKNTTVIHLTARELAHKFAREGLPFEMAQRKAKRVMRTLATAAPIEEEAAAKVERVAKMFVEKGGYTPEKAIAEANHLFGPLPADDAPREVSLRSVVRLLTVRGIPYDLAQIRARAIMLRAAAKASVQATAHGSPPAGPPPAANPFARLSAVQITAIARRIAVDNGIPLDVAQRCVRKMQDAPPGAVRVGPAATASTPTPPARPTPVVVPAAAPESTDATPPVALSGRALTRKFVAEGLPFELAQQKAQRVLHGHGKDGAK